MIAGSTRRVVLNVEANLVHPESGEEPVAFGTSTL